MHRGRAAWTGVLALHIAWLLILPDAGDKAAALLGSAVSALILLLPLASTRARRYLHEVDGDEDAIHSVLLVVPFLLPAIALAATPRLVIVELDGRSWLIVAWLSAAVARALRSRGAADGPDRPAAGSATMLFILATAALWLSILTDLGIGRVVVETDRTVPMVCRSDVLTTAFSIWEGNPAREHLFLGWRSEESFRAGAPYANHVHPYLLTMYAWVRTVRAAGGVPTFVATNTIPYLYILVLLTGFTVLLARAGLLRARNTPIRLLTLFVAYGWVVSTWRFWSDLYRFGSDNPYPLLMGVLLLAYGFLLAPMRPVAAAASGAVFVALSPIHLPMLLVAVFVLFGRQGSTVRETLTRNRPLLILALAATLAGIVSYATPWIVIAANDYRPVASSLLLRSGLDGDTRYFSNLVQAPIAPCFRGNCCWSRPIVDLLWPAFVPLALLAFGEIRKATASGTSVVHWLAFLTTPYFMSLVLFPQSVSIHSYLYDHMVLIPVAVAGAAVLLTPALERRLHGIGLLVFLLGSGGLLMANLIGIAQAIASLPR